EYLSAGNAAQGSALHFALYTLRVPQGGALHPSSTSLLRSASRAALYTLHFALCTLHFTPFENLRAALYTLREPHFEYLSAGNAAQGGSLHFTLYTLHFTLYTCHLILHTFSQINQYDIS